MILDIASVRHITQDSIVSTLPTAVFRVFMAAAQRRLITVSARPTGKAPTVTSMLVPVTIVQRKEAHVLMAQTLAHASLVTQAHSAQCRSVMAVSMVTAKSLVARNLVLVTMGGSIMLGPLANSTLDVGLVRRFGNALPPACTEAVRTTHSNACAACPTQAPSVMSLNVQIAVRRKLAIVLLVTSIVVLIGITIAAL